MLYLMIIRCGLLQNMVSHVIVQSGFVLEGYGVLTEVEHGVVIAVVRCETRVVIMSGRLETVTIVQDCSREVALVHVQVFFVKWMMRTAEFLQVIWLTSFEPRWRLLGLCLVSGVRFFVYRMTLWIPRLLGSVSGLGYHLYKDLFGM